MILAKLLRQNYGILDYPIIAKRLAQDGVRRRLSAIRSTFFEDEKEWCSCRSRIMQLDARIEYD